MFKALLEWDYRLLEVFRSIVQSPEAMDFLKYFAGPYLWTPLIGLILALLYFKDKKLIYLRVIFAAGTYILGYQICFIFLYFTRRFAPIVIENYHANSAQIIELGPDSYSFPDWLMASFMATFILLYKHISTHQNWLVPLFVLILTVMAFSRMSLGMSYPGDLLAGALIGLGLGFVMRYLMKNAEKNLMRSRPIL